MFFITVFLIFAVVYMLRRFAAFRKSKPKGMSRANWINLGWYAGAVAVIVTAETLVPSTVLTGKNRPSVVEPPHPIDDIAWSTGDVSYDTLSKAAPWAWNLGYITRDEMRQRLRTDLSLAQEDLKIMAGLDGSVGSGSYLSSEIIQRSVRLNSLIIGLESTLTDLGKLFPTTHANSTNHKTVAEADRFVAGHLKTAALQAQNGPREAFGRARAAVDAYTTAHDVAENANAPEYRALQDTLSKANYEMSVSIGAMTGLDTLEFQLGAFADVHDPRAAVPRFAHPLPVYSIRTILPDPRNVTVGPDAPWSPAHSGRVFWDAVVGHVRAPRYQVEEHRCAFVIRERQGNPLPQRLCSAAVRIPVNYDLTAQTCGADVCTESWIFPHLNITYTPNSFTVDAPRPASAAGTTPVSIWYVTWGGVEKPLTPSATFEWNATDEILGRIALRHDASPTASNVEMWRDLRMASEAAGVASQNAHAFGPVIFEEAVFSTINQLGPQFMSLGEGRKTLPEGSDWQMPRLRGAITGQRDALGVYAAEIPVLVAQDDDPSKPFASLPGGCDVFRTTYLSKKTDRNVQALKDILSDTGGAPCDAIKAYNALLQSLERATVPGSWLWLVLLDD